MPAVSTDQRRTVYTRDSSTYVECVSSGLSCGASSKTAPTCCPTVFPVVTTRCTTLRSRPRRPRCSLPSSRPPPPPPPPLPVLDKEEINRPRLGELPNLDIPLLPFRLFPIISLLMLRFSPSRLPSAPVGSGVHGDPDKVRAFLEVVLDRDTARVTAVDVGGGASSWFGMPLSVRNGDGGVLEGAGRLKACVPADGGRSGSGGGGRVRAINRHGEAARDRQNT